MNICIVGHGPSMLERKRGWIIDKFDSVVRLKRCHEMLKKPEYFGKKTDIVAGSWTIAPQLVGIGGSKRYWVLMDSRHKDVDVVKIQEGRDWFRMGGYEVVIDPWLSAFWDGKYRDMRDQMGGDGHNHMSQGSKALVYAMVYGKPTSVTLAGFDNVESGEFNWSLTRGPEWQHYPDHRWDVESKMIRVIEDYYGIPIRFL